MLKHIRLNTILITILGALLFIPFLGASHLFDWDEINFAECAREMIVSGDYLTVQINYQPFWEKPPLFIWMQVLSMKMFGINEFAARFPNAICGIFTLIALFIAGKRLKNDKFGLIWVFVYVGSVLPHFYFKSGIIDPWFNLFIFLGIYFFYLFLNTEVKRNKMLVWSAIFIALAVLTKGFVALLLFLIVGFVFLVWNKFRMRISFKQILLYIAIFLLVGGSWFMVQILSGNYQTMVDFIVYQIRLFSTKDAGHGGFPGYHFIVVFLGVFPASIFALKAFGKQKEEDLRIKAFKQWMMILFWVVLILFSIVKTKIVHYSSLSYFPLSFFATYILYKILNDESKWNKWINGLLIGIALFYTAALVFLQYVAENAKTLVTDGMIKDKFAAGNLQANVHWSGFEFVIALILLIGIVSAVFFFKKNLILRFFTIFLASALFTNLTIMVLVPRIEGYSQNAAIEFYKSKKGQDCYVETIGFKSYADLFYFEKPIPENKNALQPDWVIKGDIDKEAFYVCKNFKADYYQELHPQLIRIGEKNGFVFFMRKPVN